MLEAKKLQFAIQIPVQVELLTNALYKVNDTFKRLRFSSSILSEYYNVFQRVTHVLLVKAYHNDFLAGNVVKLTNLYTSGNYWLHVVTSKKLYEQFSKTKFVKEELFADLLVKTMPLAVFTHHYLEKNTLLYRISEQRAVYIYTALTYYPLQSIVSMSYGQLLSARLKSKLLAIALLLTLRRFGKLPANINDVADLYLYVRLIETKEGTLGIADNIIKLLPVFSKYSKQGVFDNELPKVLWEFFITLDINVSYQAVLYFCQRFTEQEQWFLSMYKEYEPEWWFLDIIQNFETKQVKLFKPQKEIITNNLSKTPIVL